MQAENRSEGLWYYNDCIAKVCKINHKQRERSNCRKQQLVSPSQVQHIICETQEDHTANCQKSTNQLHKLVMKTETMRDAEGDVQTEREEEKYIIFL